MSNISASMNADGQLVIDGLPGISRDIPSFQITSKGERGASDADYLVVALLMAIGRENLSDDIGGWLDFMNAELPQCVRAGFGKHEGKTFRDDAVDYAFTVSVDVLMDVRSRYFEARRKPGHEVPDALPKKAPKRFTRS